MEVSNDLTLTRGYLVEVKLLHLTLFNLDLLTPSTNKLQHNYFQRVPKAVINTEHLDFKSQAHKLPETKLGVCLWEIKLE